MMECYFFKSKGSKNFTVAKITAADKQGRAQKQQESIGWAALVHWEVTETGALGTGSGRQPG